MDALRQTSIIAVEDPSQVALARRTAHELATRVGLSAEQCGQVEIATVELANNLHRYAQQGKMLINAFDGQGAVEILAIDRGPGVANVSECLRDGYTSGSTPGLGLGAVKRLAQQFNIYSQLGKGTVVSAFFGADIAEIDLPGVICTALSGESFCGDRWAGKIVGEAQLLLVVDGLGHGLYASQAAELAVEVFLTTESGSPVELVETMHQALRTTRGAAVLVIAADSQRGTVSTSGVGNVSATLHGPSATQHIVSHNGTLGHQMRKSSGFQYPYHSGDLLTVHTDGISTRWSLADYPQLGSAAESIIAALIFRDHARSRDDATVLVKRLG